MKLNWKLRYCVNIVDADGLVLYIRGSAAALLTNIWLYIEEHLVNGLKNHS